MHGTRMQVKRRGGMGLLRWNAFGDFANDFACARSARRRNIDNCEGAFVYRANRDLIFPQGGGQEVGNPRVVSGPNRYHGSLIGAFAWLLFSRRLFVIRRFVLLGSSTSASSPSLSS